MNGSVNEYFIFVYDVIFRRKEEEGKKKRRKKRYLLITNVGFCIHLFVIAESSRDCCKFGGG
jgi:hypothetical protein